MQYLHNICMHNLWKPKRQISLRTSLGLNGENQVFEMVYYLILTWKSLLKKTRVHYFIEKLNQEGLASGLRVSDLLWELRTVDIF